MNSYPPGDTGYWAGFWNSASDSAQPGNWYQAVYAMLQPGNPYGIPEHTILIQTTIQPGYGYMYCNPQYGMSLYVGASGQTDGGCIGNADTLGLVSGNYYYVEIYQTQDCASGVNGCTYGCNGNTRFAIDGKEIGHFADCTSYDGMNGITAAMLEPTDADGTTPITATNLYSSVDYLGYFEAVINGTAYTPIALNQTCGYSPPPGAGSIVYSNTEAAAATYGATCPSGGAAPARGASSANTASTPPQPPPFSGAVAMGGSVPKPVGTPPQAASQPKLIYDPARGNLPVTHLVLNGHAVAAGVVPSSPSSPARTPVLTSGAVPGAVSTPSSTPGRR